MRFSRIKLTNWKNFREADVVLPDRAFLVGPNASGKSNFLDAFRFLRDLAVPGGGLQRACEDRGGVSRIRCLSARRHPGVEITVELVDDGGAWWQYRIVFTRGQFPTPGNPVVHREEVRRDDKILLSRPDDEDKDDPRLLSQTALEQISRNKSFRRVVDHFAGVYYLHLVPQMIRDTAGYLRDQSLPDMYGGRFLERVAKTPEKTRKARLRRIENVLRIAVPQLKNLELRADARGVPHLEAVYTHWRPKGAKQDENQLSDGTLRLIGLLRALQDGSGLLLLEEPELALHTGIIRRLASFIHRAQTRDDKPPRQVFMSTHSFELLSDPGIGPDELLMFAPGDNGTTVAVGADLDDIRHLMENGLLAAEVAIARTESPNFQQLELF